MNTNFDLVKLILTMLRSTGVTLEVFFLTLVIALPLALVFAAGRMSKIKFISAVTNIFMLIIRGTPLMLQLIFVYFAPSFIAKSLGVKIVWPRFTAAIVAMVINYACYFAEIYRGGLQSMPKGQYEAAKMLGFTRSQTFVRIILPQVFKVILPSMGNEVITLVKDTALVQVLGVVELFHVANTQTGRLVNITPLFIAGVFYFVMNLGVSKLFDFAEKKLGYYK